jgi:hypothetical protein
MKIPLKGTGTISGSMNKRKMDTTKRLKMKKIRSLHGTDANKRMPEEPKDTG